MSAVGIFFPACGNLSNPIIPCLTTLATFLPRIRLAIETKAYFQNCVKDVHGSTPSYNFF
jgi:hypothetical protein